MLLNSTHICTLLTLAISIYTYCQSQQSTNVSTIYGYHKQWVYLILWYITHIHDSIGSDTIIIIIIASIHLIIILQDN